MENTSGSGDGGVDERLAANIRANIEPIPVNWGPAHVPALLRLLDDSTAIRAQGQFNEALLHRIQMADHYLQGVHSALEQILEGNMALYQTSERDLIELRSRHQALEQQFSTLQIWQRRIDGSLRSLRSGMYCLTRSETPSSETHARESDQGVSGVAPSRGTDAKSDALVDFSREEFDYLLFEMYFRGSTDEIKKRQRGYLDLFREKKAVVDLGCGRGEFVQLLNEQNINIIGVDMNPDMIEMCRERHLNVVLADVFAYLEGVASGTLDGIFAVQLVEHLETRQIIRLLHLCERALQPGGVLVVETVNPSCPIALGNFYTDPTHVRPLPPNLLWFLTTSHGYTVQTVRFTSPLSQEELEAIDVAGPPNLHVPTYQDYAVIALRNDESEG